MKKITTVEIFAIRVLISIQKLYGFNLVECQINWAISQVTQGAESLSLYALAGMSSFDNPFEIDQYFFKALNELNIKLPSGQEAIENFVVFICQNILDGTLSTRVGCEVLAAICVDLHYQDYYAWYELLEELTLDLISESEFEKNVRAKANEIVTPNT